MTKIRDALGVRPRAAAAQHRHVVAGCPTRQRLSGNGAAVVVALIEATILLSAHVALGVIASAAQAVALAILAPASGRGVLMCLVPAIRRVVHLVGPWARALWVSRRCTAGVAHALHMPQGDLRAVFCTGSDRRNDCATWSLSRCAAIVVTLELATAIIIILAHPRGHIWASLHHWRHVQGIHGSALTPASPRLIATAVLDWPRLADAVLLAPIREELLFRVLLWRVLRNRVVCTTTCAALASALFALSHLANAATAVPEAVTEPAVLLLQVVSAFAAGLLYSALIAVGRGWWECVLLHVANNALAALVPPAEMATALHGGTEAGATWLCAACVSTAAVHACLGWHLVCIADGAKPD